MYEIDLNCDVGEGIESESKLFPYMSSCNIACGGHFGDKISMINTVLLAKKHHIKIGAHPSYPDRKYFGRRSIKIGEEELKNSILEQINALTEVLFEHNLKLHHIKPHGALYNDIAVDLKKADLYLNVMEFLKKDLTLFLPANSVVFQLAQKRGFKCWAEAFGDRTYLSGASLVPRTEAMAIIHDPEKVALQITQIVTKKKVNTSKGHRSTIVADTICIHGDTPNALQILMYLSRELPNQNILVKK